MMVFMTSNSMVLASIFEPNDYIFAVNDVSPNPGFDMCVNANTGIFRAITIYERSDGVVRSSGFSQEYGYQG